MDFVVQRLDFLLARRGQQEVVHLRLQRVIHLERRERVAGTVAKKLTFQSHVSDLRFR